MKYLLSVVLIVAAVIVGNALIPARAPAMGSTQFGTFSEGYLKRKAERAEQRKMRPVPIPKSRPFCFDFRKDDSVKGFRQTLEDSKECAH